VHARHEGPLRLLKTLYPEGPGLAHAVLVHPPGGLVGGDRLDIVLDVQAGAHLLVTTPAATRFYRSIAGEAAQVVQARVAAGATLEWVPLETLAYPSCEGRNELRFELEPGARLLASEVLGLGLPAAGESFETGRLLQHLEINGQWLDRGRIDAQDRALLDGPCGLAGQRVIGTLLLAQAELPGDLDALLEHSRSLLTGLPRAGVTHLRSPSGSLLLARALGAEVEVISRPLQALRSAWREALWGQNGKPPRLWAL
jgi:urease accessory protein